MWDALSGTLVADFTGHQQDVTCVAFSLDNRFVISGSGDRTIKVWDIASQTLFKTLEGHKNWVRSLVPSPDSIHLASGGDDQRLLLWELPEKEKVKPVDKFKRSHSNWIYSLAYAEKGNYLVSVSHDNKLAIRSSVAPLSQKAVVNYVQYRNRFSGPAGHQYPSKVEFQPHSYNIAVATLGKGIVLTNYFQKLFKIPHRLNDIQVNNRKYKDFPSLVTSSQSRVVVKGTVSRPRYVGRMFVERGKGMEDNEVSLKRRSGKFKVIMNLKPGSNRFDLVITDADPQINNSVYILEVAFEN